MSVAIHSQTTVTYTYDSDEESWVGTDGTGWTTIWGSTAGNPNGCLLNQYASENSQTSMYRELTTTWSALGISSEQIITDLQIDFDWRCALYTSMNSASLGATELRDGSGNLLATLDSGVAITGTTSYVTRSTSTVSVPLANGGASDQVKIRINITADGRNASADIRIPIDNIDLNITHRRRRVGAN